MATAGGAASGSLAGRSSALLGSLLALPPAETTAAVIERHLEVTATLLGRDWVTLVQHVLDDDGTAPVGVAWRAGYALHHLGHLGDALRVLGYADPGRAGDADWARLAGMRSSTAWGRGDLETCRASAEEALKYARVAGDPGAEASAWVANAMLAAFDGDRDLNLQCYERALVLADERRGPVLPPRGAASSPPPPARSARRSGSAQRTRAPRPPGSAGSRGAGRGARAEPGRSPRPAGRSGRRPRRP